MLKRVETEGKISSILLIAGAPTLTHLLFVDDIILPAKADEPKAYEFMNILNKFSTTTRQRINLRKSSLTFGRRVPHPNKTIGQPRLEHSNVGGTMEVFGHPNPMEKVKGNNFILHKRQHFSQN